MNFLTVESERKSWQSWEEPIRNTLHISLLFLKRNNLSLEVFLISNAHIQKINKKYRGKDAPTNVLSFTHTNTSFLLSKKTPHYNGEIYLAPQYIIAHKEDYHALAIHGLLHILGYTHDNDRAMMKMERLEHMLRARI